MSRNRIAVGVATAALGLVLTAGVAQADNCYVGCTPSGVLPNSEVAPTTTTTAAVLPAEEAAPALALTPESAAVSPATSAGAQLPFTGADVAELTVIGLGAVGAGLVAVRRSRRRTTS